MKSVIVLATLLMIITTASAETLNVNGCNVTFNMVQPHEVKLPRSEINRNGSYVYEIDLINISSANGFVIMVISRSNLTTQQSFADALRAANNDLWGPEMSINEIEIDNTTGWYSIHYLNGMPVYSIMYYIQNPSGADYVSAPSGKEMTISNIVMSTLPLYETADFLRGLQIKPSTRANLPRSSSL